MSIESIVVELLKDKYKESILKVVRDNWHWRRIHKNKLTSFLTRNLCWPEYDINLLSEKTSQPRILYPTKLTLKNDYNGMKLEINKVEKWKVHKYLEIKHTLKQSMSQKVKYKWNKKTLWMSKNEKKQHIKSY